MRGRPYLVDNRSAATSHAAALRYLVGDLPAKHELSIATGYVNVGGLREMAVTVTDRGVRLLLGAAPDPALGADLPLTRFETALASLTEQRDLARFPPSRAAKELAIVEAWLRRPDVEVRRFLAQFLHGKTYLFGNAEDGRAALVTSANLTYSGLNRNLELGLVHYDPPIVALAMNEAGKQPAMNLGLARVYLKHSDPMVSERTWQHVLDEIIKLKTGPTQYRWQTAAKDKAFDLIRSRLLIETQAEHFLQVLKKGTVSTNAYLRKTHNFALDMNWLPACVIPRRQWPAIHFKEKRAITLAEHQQIIAAETNTERRNLYQLCWHLGASQGDIAMLKGEDVDWTNNTVSFFRKKTGVPVLVHLGSEALNLLKDLPAEGPLFPYLSKVRAGDRATEFKQRCQQLKIHGVTLHSYRYAWAERAKTAGYPERFAQEALGHNSKAVHRAYAKRALVKIPSLEEYEKRNQQAPIPA